MPNRTSLWRISKDKREKSNWVNIDCEDGYNGWIHSFYGLESSSKKTFDHIIALSKQHRPFYEFGGWRGEAFRYLIKTFKKGYGFDTFEGIPEDWHNEKAGSYSSEGNIPIVDGGEFIVGKFEDSLPDFFAKKSDFET